jgi:uncharacterized membrane protein (UPF0127 family)
VSASPEQRRDLAPGNFTSADYDAFAAGYVEKNRNVSHETYAILLHDDVMRQTQPADALAMRAFNRTRGTVLCERLESAGGVGGRGRGLLGRDRLEPGTGMLFENGRFTPFMWMHMFFMRFAIDIVFIGRDDRVVRINRELRPWQVSSVVCGARRALELPAGAASGSSTQVGDHITLESVR